MAPLISVLIPTYKAVDYLLCCVKSIVSDVNTDLYEVCIYGDGGGEDSRLALLKCEEICKTANVKCRTLYNPQNLGNTPAVNGARKLASGEWLFLVNDDMVFPTNWVAQLQTDFKTKTVVSVSCIEPDAGGHVPAKCFVGQNLGLDPLHFDISQLDSFNEQLFENGVEEGVHYPFCVEAVVFDNVGRADERFIGPYHDPDLFLRFRLSQIKMIRTRKLWLYHFSGISQRFIDSPQKRAKKGKSKYWRTHENTARLLFIKKWGAKPKAKFGEIPKTKVLMPYEGRPHTVLEVMKYSALFVWEYTRYMWQKIIL